MIKMIKKLMSVKFIRYGLSSLLAFAINYTILLFFKYEFSEMTLNLEIAIVIGWIVSSNANFFINRVFVFRDNGKLAPAYIKYYGVAAPVFLIKNLGIFELLVRVIHIPEEIASPISETLMFIITYFFQKLLVFRQKKPQRNDG